MRIFTAGFETRDRSEMSTAEPDSSAVVNSLLGGYALNATNIRTIFPQPINEFYVRFIYNMAASTAKYKRFRVLNQAGATIGSFEWQAGDVMRIYRADNTEIAKTTAVMRKEWCVYEIYYKYADDTTTRKIEIRRDGVSILDAPNGIYTGATKITGANDIPNAVHWGTAAFQHFQIDDIAINDTSGTADNSWCGFGHVVPLNPDSDVQVNFTRVTTNPSSTANWMVVDERPAVLTDLVESSSPGATDFYGVQDFTLHPEDTIQRVWVRARARVENTDDGASILLGIRSGSQEGWSPEIDLGVEWLEIRSPDFTTAIGWNWDQSTLNNLQVAMRVPNA